MAELVGSRIQVPADAWNPPDVDSQGWIKKHFPPTKKYPFGRYEIVLQVRSWLCDTEQRQGRQQRREGSKGRWHE